MIRCCLYVFLLSIIGSAIFILATNSQNTFSLSSISMIAEPIAIDFKEGMKVKLPQKKISMNLEKRINIEPERVEEVLIAEHTINNPSSEANRNINMALASKRINGYILKPGEKFSWLEIVGNPTAEDGYKEAGEIKEGKKTRGIGGGICQVSSTISTAIQKTAQKVDVEHFHAETHSLDVGYLATKKGDKEASVAYTSQKDFWFISTLENPIKIDVIAWEGSVTVKIFEIRKI